MVSPLRALSLLATVCLAALPLALAGCATQGHGAPQGGSTVTPAKAKLKRHVELVQATQEKMTSSVETVGYLDAEGQTDVAAGVSGIVEEVLFREGDWVVKDETLLVRIEPKKYDAMLAQAEANLMRAEANVKKMEASIRKCDSGIRDAEQFLDLKRIMLENIRRAGRAAKTEERQEAQSMVEVAAARVGVAKSERDVCKADMDASKKDVDAARAMRDLAAHNLDRSQVRAPYTGQINKRMVTRGSYVEDKTVFATMADLSRLRLVGYIPEKSAPIARAMLAEEQRSRIGFLAGNATAGPWTTLAALACEIAGEVPAKFPLEFRLSAFPQQKFYGRIFFLSSVASPDTHLFECKAEVPRHGLAAQLRPGFTAKITCPLPGRPNSVVIPEEAVRASERGFVAFRPKAVPTKDDEPQYVAEAVPLELGQRKPGWVEVLSGLHPGDWIVKRGAEALEEGTPMSVPREQIKQMMAGPRNGAGSFRAAKGE
jgi:multidrug efflux system membrane fusion protein